MSSSTEPQAPGEKDVAKGLRAMLSLFEVDFFKKLISGFAFNLSFS